MLCINANISPCGLVAKSIEGLFQKTKFKNQPIDLRRYVFSLLNKISTFARIVQFIGVIES